MLEYGVLDEFYCEAFVNPEKSEGVVEGDFMSNSLSVCDYSFLKLMQPHVKSFDDSIGGSDRECHHIQECHIIVEGVVVIERQEVPILDRCC